MAKRRMFSMDIIDTDFFLEMPATAQLLYFHLALRADDDGFIAAPKRILRLTGASEGDLATLFDRKFVIPFASGVCVIRHWKIHNYIQKDRYRETIYKDEKLMLKEDTNGVYEMDTKCVQDVSKLDTQVRLGKDRLVKDSLGKNTDNFALDNEKIPYEEIISYLNEKTDSRYRSTETTKKLIHARMEEGFTKEDFFKVIDTKVSTWKGTEWEKYLRPETLFCASKFQGYLNEKPSEKKHAGSKEGYSVDLSKYETL